MGKGGERGVGRMGEHSLHEALKKWYARPGDRFEVEVEGYVVDIVRGDLLIEIQTGSFAAMRNKLEALTARHPLRLVHPIAREKWVVYLGPDGLTETGRRKSPEHRGLIHVFDELVSIPELVLAPGFSVEVLVTQEEEVRRQIQTRSGRRRTVKFDRRLVAVEGRREYCSPADFRSFLPAHLERPFTSLDLARALGHPLPLARRMTYCMRIMGAIRTVGKRRNALLYDV
jgi:hypothetical protein